MKASFLLLCACFALAPADAWAATVDVTASTRDLPLSTSLELFEDPTGALGPDAVIGPSARAPFVPWTGRFAPNLGFTKSVLWVRFTLRNGTTAPLERWLEIDQPDVDDIRVFLPGETRSPQGRLHPASTMELRRRTYAYRIVLPPRTEMPVHLRFESMNELQVPLVLWEAGALAEHDTLRGLAIALIYGVMLAMALYNLFLFAFTRQRGNLYYCLSATSFVAWLALLDGTSTFVLAAGNVLPRWPFIVSATLGITGTLLVARELLATKAGAPRLDRLLVTWIGFLLAMLAVSMMLLDWRTANKVSVGLAPLSPLIGGSIAIRRWRDGVPGARFYALGWIAILAFLIPAALATQGVLPFQGPGLLLHLGFMTEAIFVALALADATRLRNEHIARLHEAGSRFVPFEFLRLLGRTELPEVREGDRVEREMTVFFSDIRGYTTAVEHLSPDETLRFVNDYLKEMEPRIRARGGFIDKYIGDAVMALFESPTEAVQAAVDCFAALDEMNAKRQAAGERRIEVGIGLHTGQLVLGTVGSSDRLACTVLGDSVNLASRIEGLTRKYGTRLLVSGSTAAQLPPGRILRTLDRVAVKGKAQPVEIVEVVDALPQPARDLRRSTLDRFAEARQAATLGRHAQAISGFEACFTADPEDVTARQHADRSRRLMANDTDEPWDGVVRMEAK